MLEVAYISPSYKQAAEFIDRLIWDLRKHEIYDIEIDQRNLRLKTDKFIVSAVDIFGRNVGRSYRFAKYYIDKAEPTTFEMWQIFEKINDAVKDIKMRFPRDTKEISEEELIEILTEVSV